MCTFLAARSFEGLIAPFIAKTVKLCQQLINDAQLNWGQVNRVLMVGGSCRIPYVRRTLEKEVGCTIINVDEPELAVCLGAALKESSRDKTTGLKSSDFTPPPAYEQEGSNIRFILGNQFTPLNKETKIYTSSLCLNDDGKLLAVQGISLIYIIDMKLQKTIKTINISAAYHSIFFSEDDKYLIGLGMDNLDIYDLEKSKVKTRVTISLFNGKFGCLSLHKGEIAFLRQGNGGSQYFLQDKHCQGARKYSNPSKPSQPIKSFL